MRPAAAVASFLLLSLSTAVNAQKPGQFGFSDQGLWRAGTQQTVVFTLNEEVKDTLFLDSITIAPSTPSPNAPTITACQNQKYSGSQVNARCGTGPCTAVTCSFQVPKTYPGTAGFLVTATWKDCASILGLPAIGCGTQTSLSEVSLRVLGENEVVSTTTSAAVSTTSAVASSTRAATPSASPTSPPVVPKQSTSTENDKIQSNGQEGTPAKKTNVPVIVGSIIGALGFLVIAGAFVLQYKRKRDAGNWDPDFGTMGRTTTVQHPSLGRPGTVSSNVSSPKLRTDFHTLHPSPFQQRPMPPPPMYASPQQMYSSPAPFQTSPAPYPMAPMAPTNVYIPGGAVPALAPPSPPVVSPRTGTLHHSQSNPQLIQETGVDRVTTGKNMGLHVVNWEGGTDRPTSPAESGKGLLEDAVYRDSIETTSSMQPPPRTAVKPPGEGEA